MPIDLIFKYGSKFKKKLFKLTTLKQIKSRKAYRNNFLNYKLILSGTFFNNHEK